MKYSPRMLERMIYDGNVSRALQFLVQIVEQQEKEIQELKEKLNESSDNE